MRNAHNPQVYIPQPEYSNGDFLVYSVFDGVQESAEARFDFKFFAKDNLPITTAVAARVDEDSVLGVRIQLNGSDVGTVISNETVSKNWFSNSFNVFYIRRIFTV